MRNLRLRDKLLVMAMPLVVVPLLLLGGVIGAVATRSAYLGVTKASRDDLAHMASFATDLLSAHNQQFTVYKADKKAVVRRDLATLTDFAWNLVDAQNGEVKAGRISLDRAKAKAAEALKKVNVGQTGYIYAMNSKGTLVAHVAREGENILDERDENGRMFIREMCNRAVEAPPGEVLHIVYPWKNPMLGDERPREKTVAYRYFREWDWIVAAGGYLDETYEDATFEKRSFEELKAHIKEKKVGQTGYIYALNSKGVAVIHPSREGEDLSGAVDDEGRRFIGEMLQYKSGWIRYPWRNEGESAPRMKIVRYEYFEPWDWIVAVGSYENEFLHDAQEINQTITLTVVAMTIGCALAAGVLLFRASRAFTEPVARMTEVIRQVKRGRLDARMEIDSKDELGEMADAFNRMSDILATNRELEANLARQGKMASIGVLSSGVAHEINNPLGVILGYAAYLEKKLDPDDPNLKYIQEIHRESRRSKKIVQDLLSFARTPRPELAETDLNDLLEKIVSFASNHTDMAGIEVVTYFDQAMPKVMLDPDQMRQVAINLILNAGAAMKGQGSLYVVTSRDGVDHVKVVFRDTGEGIPPESLQKIFEPFYTTKTKGTGLGLAITRQLVESHHGAISIESEVGKGTTVTVRLPVEHTEF